MADKKNIGPRLTEAQRERNAKRVADRKYARYSEGMSRNTDNITALTALGIEPVTKVRWVNGKPTKYVERPSKTLRRARRADPRASL